MRNISISKRKFIRLLLALVVSISWTTITAQAVVSTQTSSDKNALPFDPQIRRGTLPNGFTYYIRHNNVPENRVFMYLVNKVGSVLETDNQQGLAHFMEHMNFNGTTHFPKNELVNYLQKSGVQFGGDLNAYTSFDETVYQLPLPTDDPGLLKNGFLVMRDWAKGATLTQSEIDKERGVVLEEKRLGKGAGERLSNQYLPIVLNHSRYSKRIPIGKEEILNSFTRNDLLDFYNTWYRPNLQALIVVGNINVDSTEQVIKKLFSDLRNPKPEIPRTEYKIPLNDENHFFLGTDQELTMPMIQTITKFPKERLRNRQEYRQSLIRFIFNYILGERLSDLSQKPNSPFIQTGAQADGFIANLDAFTTQVVAEPQKLKNAFIQMWTEVERAKKFGFTEAEVKRGKGAIMQHYENAYAERENANSGDLVAEYTRNFLDDESVTGIEYEYHLTKELMNEISLQDINAAAHKYILSLNRDILVMGPDAEKDILPKEPEILSWIKQVEKSDMTAPDNREDDSLLMPEKPEPGKIVSQEVIDSLHLTKLTLSNGMKIYLKPTTIKNDEIYISAFSPGGTSLYSDDDFFSAGSATDLIDYSGVGNFTAPQLQKYLSDKRVSISPYIGERFEGISGSSSKRDLETAFQLINLYMTHPRSDMDGFKGEIEKTKTAIAVRGNDPDNVYGDTITAVLSNHSIRRMAPTVASLNKIDLNRAYQIYKERFSDASDFSFVLVGSFNTDSIKPLITTYLASLPSNGRIEKARDLNIHIPSGKISKTIHKGMEDKATVTLVYSGTLLYSAQQNLILNALSDILTNRLLDNLREKESGVYGVSANASTTKFPENRYSVSIQFGCSKENVEKLIAATLNAIDDLKKNPPSADEVQKVVSEDMRAFELNLKDNSYWSGYISNQLMLDEDLLNVYSYVKRLKTVNPSSLQKAAQQYLSGANFARFVLEPEK